MNIADGLELRTAEERDLGQICTLLAERGDEADAEDLLLVANDPDEGLDAVLVVVDGNRVVSTATLLRESVAINGVVVPTGQVEMVATDPSFEGRGLVRALMNEAHQRSADRDELLQVMIGIPFFYRQFGYSYAMPIPLPCEVTSPPPIDRAIIVRPATPQDIAAMVALQTAAQSSADVQMPHSGGCWRWLVARSGSVQLVAERDDQILATGRHTPPEEGVVLGEVAGSPEGIRALVAFAATLDDAGLAVLERPASGLNLVVADIVEQPVSPERSREWFYSRVPSLGPLLDHLRPVLLDRFRSSGLSGRHEVLVSSWRSHVRFSIDEDFMSAVVTGGPHQYPVSIGGSGVPPDAVAPLLLGPFGAAGLEPRHGDFILGRQRDLMEALFPPLVSDLLTFYLAL